MRWRKRFFPGKKRYFMGGELSDQNGLDATAEPSSYRAVDAETYFRPSCLPVLNTAIESSFFNPYIDRPWKSIHLPQSLTLAPEKTVLHYFSVLREAENLTDEKAGGCGTVGQTHLIKLNQLEGLRYFVEIETIQGSNQNVTFFAYYHGIVRLEKHNGRFLIGRITWYGEDFLCAAYHLWQHNAETSLDIKFGSWCKLIKKRWPVRQNGYVKTIDFDGTDGGHYRFVYFQLTNGTDVLAKQLRKNSSGQWELIHLDADGCL
ncbi:hypothetical protein [Bacillus siamensis]|uniref:hypothetical protein n=1 Tax=Bacillus siamensis TaxID=659243 RepID=UPI002E1E5DFC|nr:hypothetical protein [Bacillus siamensis]MED0774483.1 hypothetical protein [Bacillus siamensis]MED0779417.1 hypothetical protein [Bacillus siamensis]MED0834003.1 hypothetical protein [Bacillus siamensis]